MKTKKQTTSELGRQTTISITKLNENVYVRNDHGLNLKFPLYGSQILVSTAIAYSVTQQLKNEELIGKQYKLTLTIEEL